MATFIKKHTVLLLAASMGILLAVLAVASIKDALEVDILKDIIDDIGGLETTTVVLYCILIRYL